MLPKKTVLVTNEHNFLRVRSPRSGPFFLVAEYFFVVIDEWYLEIFGFTDWAKDIYILARYSMLIEYRRKLTPRKIIYFNFGDLLYRPQN